MSMRFQRSASRTPDRAAIISELENEGLFPLEWTDGPGVVYPEHSHPRREVRIVLEGSMTMGTGGQEYVLHAGDRIDLPPGQEHWARVGPSGVRYLAGTEPVPAT